jgi:hypothetical protein
MTAITIALLALLLFFKVAVSSLSRSCLCGWITGISLHCQQLFSDRVPGAKQYLTASLKSAWFRISRFIRSP